MSVNRADKPAFAESLGGLLELYGRKITPAAAELWWSAFESHSLAAVQVAFSRYVQDPEQGRYPPTPAAVMGCLPSTGPSRLSADEAWALALGAFDEADTVCVTDEILEAVAVASPVWESGDKIGARMAFKSAYERIAGERRQHGQSPTWRLSLGWDGERRTLAAQEALRLGRMTADQVQAYLPEPPASGPAAAIAGLLSGKVVAFPVDDDALTRKRMAQLRQAINGGESRKPASDPVAEREAFNQRKHEAVEAIARMQSEREGAHG